MAQLQRNIHFLLVISLLFKPFCHPALGAGMNQTRFTVDGLSLGSKVVPAGAVYREYSCQPSEQYASFTVCRRTKDKVHAGRTVSYRTTILHEDDGTVRYVNQTTEPGLLDVEGKIAQLSKEYGPPVRSFQTGSDVRDLKARILVWGKLELAPLTSAEMSTVQEGANVRQGFLVDFIGGFQRSAKLGLPVYRIEGEAGLVLVVTSEDDGRSRARIFAADAGKMSFARNVASRRVEPPSVGSPTPAPPSLSVVSTAAKLPIEATPQNTTQEEMQKLLLILQGSIHCPKEPNLVNGETFLGVDKFTGDHATFRVETAVTASRLTPEPQIYTYVETVSFDYDRIEEVRLDREEIIFECRSFSKCVQFTTTRTEESGDGELGRLYSHHACSSQNAEDIKFAVDALIERSRQVAQQQ